VEAIFVLPKIRYIQRLNNINASHMLTCLLHMKTFFPSSFTIVPILKCLNLDPSTPNCFKWVKFCFILQNQHGRFSLILQDPCIKVTKIKYKVKSQIMLIQRDQTGKKRERERQNFPLDRVNQSLNLAKKGVEYLFNL